MNKLDNIYNKISKIDVYLKKKILYFNIKNKNVQNLAYREHCYRKLEKKYHTVINKFEPIAPTINNSNKVWFCWFQGIENAPDLVKKCYESVKKYIKNKEIIVITLDNFSDYVTIPDYILDKKEKGYIENAAFSDLLRLELLSKYGGLWIDSTVLVTKDIDKNFFDNEMFVYKNISLYQREEMAIRASSWLMYSKCNNNKIISLTKELFLDYWKNNNHLPNYFLIHLLFSLAARTYNDEWNKIPTYSNIPPHILQFELLNQYSESRFNEIKEMSCFHKLHHRIKTEDKGSFYFHIVNEEI